MRGFTGVALGLFGRRITVASLVCLSVMPFVATLWGSRDATPGRLVGRRGADGNGSTGRGDGDSATGEANNGGDLLYGEEWGTEVLEGGHVMSIL